MGKSRRMCDGVMVIDSIRERGIISEGEKFDLALWIRGSTGRRKKEEKRKKGSVEPRANSILGGF